jgi:hypothetical protein
MSAMTVPAGEWLSGPRAAQMLGARSTKSLRRLAASGLITVLKVPGANPRYRRQDVECVVRESVRPALRLVHQSNEGGVRP